jgi:RNA polymerase sigma-70 factor (ECF subfamily)
MVLKSVEELFTEAFEQYADALFRHTFFRISDEERARDITQETFMRVWNYLQKGNAVKDLRAFLYQTLNNLIIDEYRKKKTASLDALLEDETTSEGSFDDLVIDGALEEAATRFDAEALMELLSVLPEQYRNMVTLRYIDGFSPKEIAKLVGESENVVSVRLHRSMRKLKTAFEERMKHFQQ